MAIKDIIGPGFVGTTTIKWLPTRGFSIGTVAVDVVTLFHPLRGSVGNLAVLCGAVNMPNSIAYRGAESNLTPCIGSVNMPNAIAYHGAQNNETPLQGDQ